MQIITESAFAKVNLTLDVLSKRTDGYHDLCSVMQTISLCDDVRIHIGTNAPWAVHCHRKCESDTAGLPQDEKNLVWKAAELFFGRTGIEPSGIEIFIRKRIPSEAGLGGGSADAAAVLRALNRHFENPLCVCELCRLGADAGADVPFCVLCGTALAEGIGERLTKLPGAPQMFFAVCKPDFSVSTGSLYGKIDEAEIIERPDQQKMLTYLQNGDLSGIGASLCNVFEPLVSAEHTEIDAIRAEMLSCGAFGARMTGSGSAVFGIFDTAEKAEKAGEKLKQKYPCVYTAHNV